MFSCFLLASGALAASGSDLSLTLLDSPAYLANSRCLDGSPYGYYTRLNPASKRWVVYLEGGGLCTPPMGSSGDDSGCKERAKTSLGTSTVWTSTMDPTPGTSRDILNNDPKINPFADWNHVYLPYCSGDTWSGTKTEKTSEGFYFTGHYNFKAVITHLNETEKLGLTFETVLLTGASAGGIGTFANADFLREDYLPKQDGLVLAAPMSGYYFPSPIIPYSEWLKAEKAGMSPGDLIGIGHLATKMITNYFGTAVDTTCAAENKNNTAMCWDASFLYPYISTPLFVIENRFDKNQIDAHWLPPSFQPKNETRSDGYIAYYGGQMHASLGKFADDRIGQDCMMPKNKTEGILGGCNGNALFMPSCYMHVEDVCMKSGPTIEGRQMGSVLKEWVDMHIAGDSNPNFVFMDQCNDQEDTDMPCSKTCNACLES